MGNGLPLILFRMLGGLIVQSFLAAEIIQGATGSVR